MDGKMLTEKATEIYDMKRFFTALLVSMLLSIFPHSVCAQGETVGTREGWRLTEDEKKQYIHYVKQKVEEFQYLLAKIVDMDLPHVVRKESVTNALSLFIGEGEPYDYVGEAADQRIHSEGVKMYTSSVNRSATSTQKLKHYLYKLYNPQTGSSSMPYTKIELTGASVLIPDSVFRVDNHYECIGYLKDIFLRRKDGRYTYRDVTEKKVRCRIVVIELPAGQRMIDAKLGDIYVLCE